MEFFEDLYENTKAVSSCESDCSDSCNDYNQTPDCDDMCNRY